ncbi:hypothetical protein L6452_26227 [Arctium lappa]|uniref:Uncharacterized protein n=1 Tax=Arctium lappa TaxID=4217 RepID=A0ACB9AC78_ARCLA|nr:hypothetical protein L6452_26227 [Arctium lappa]
MGISGLLLVDGNVEAVKLLLYDVEQLSYRQPKIVASTSTVKSFSICSVRHYTALSLELKSQFMYHSLPQISAIQNKRPRVEQILLVVNVIRDESLVCEGLALNDELQRVLDKHESLVSGASAPSEKSTVVAKHEALVSGVSAPSEKLKPKTSQLSLVQVDAPLTDTRERQNPGSTDGACADAETRFPAPTTTSGLSATSVKVNPMFDLLSGDDFITPTTGNFLAIVPLGEPQPATPVSGQNLMSQNSKPQNLAQEQTYSSSPQIQHISSKQPSSNLNGSLPQHDLMSKNAQGSIPASGQTYSSSPKFIESQHFPSQQLSVQPNESIHNTITPQYEPMSLYTQASSPAARQRFSSLPQLEQSQHFPSQQPSFGPNGSVSVILPPQYEPRSPCAQGSSPTAEQTYSSSPHFQHFLTQPPSFNPNGSLTSMVPLQSEPTSPYSQEFNHAWTGHTPQQQQPSSPVYDDLARKPYGLMLMTICKAASYRGYEGAQTRHGGLPPPPWETQPEDSNQLGGMHYATLGNENNQPMRMYMQQQISGGGLPPMSPQAIHPQQHIASGTPPPMSHQAIHPQQHIASGTPPPLTHQAIRPQQHITGNPPSPMSHKAAIHLAQQQITSGHPLPVSHKAIYPSQQQITGGPPSPMIHQTIHLEQIPQQQFQGQHTMGVIPHYHMAYMYPQQMYGDPMAQTYGYGGGYRYSYGYTQPQHAQFLDHRMSCLSVRDDGFLNSSTVYANPSTSNASDVHMPSLNPSNPEDKLFQDLLDFTHKTTGKPVI